MSLSKWSASVSIPMPCPSAWNRTSMLAGTGSTGSSYSRVQRGSSQRPTGPSHEEDCYASDELDCPTARAEA